MFKITGKLHVKSDVQVIKETFRKREFVLAFADNPLYPQYIKFELIQDKCDLIEPFNPGDEIEVNFNIRGREWTNPDGKKVYFNSLDAWKINAVQANTGANPANQPGGDLPVYDAGDAPADDVDDLPF